MEILKKVHKVTKKNYNEHIYSNPEAHLVQTDETARLQEAISKSTVKRSLSNYYIKMILTPEN